MLDDVPHAVPLAGGLDVVTGMKTGAGPSTLVWLGGIPDASAPILEGDSLVLPAGCRHDQLVQSPIVARAFPDLATAWSGISNIRIRSQGTVVGNLMAGVAGYEAAVLLMAVGATLAVLMPGGGTHAIGVADLGSEDGPPMPTPRLVTAVHIPLPKSGRAHRLAYDRSLRPGLSVALGLETQDGTIVRARAILGGCHARPILRELPLGGAELSTLRGQDTRIASLAFADLPPPSAPWLGEPGYRALMAPLLLSRLLKALS